MSSQSQNFGLKKVWKNPESEEETVPSLRFSSEVYFMIEIIYEELINMKDKRATTKKTSNVEETIAGKIMQLVFFRIIKKVAKDLETLKLNLYPYLRETKKQILVEEAMQISGDTYMELVDVIIFFFAKTDYQPEKTDNHFLELKNTINNLRGAKIQDIFVHLREKNQMNPAMLPVKHFENAMFHSLSPYDFTLRLKKDVMVKMFQALRTNSEEVALLKPTKNDQLFQQFNDSEEFKFKDFIVSLKTYPEKFKITIPTRQFVMNSKPKVQKCKDC